MEVGYDKAALQEYMDQIGTVGEQIHRRQDESLNLYNSCKQQYNRIHTKLEEASHRAYNQVENAESMRRSAEFEYETARRTAENAEDEDTKNAAMQKMRQAQIMRAEADEEYSKASIAYSKASGDLKSLSELWDGNAPALESQAHRVEEGMASFSRLATNGNNDLGEYISIMDKAQTALYGDSGDGMSSNGGSTSYGSTTSTAGTQGSKSNSGQRTTGSSFQSKLGNTVGIVAAANGLNAISMNIGGKVQTFPGTKSGIAKAHRSALKSGDAELASYTSKMFSSTALSNDLGMGKTGESVSSDTTSVSSSSPSISADNRQIAAAMDDNGTVYLKDGELEPNTTYELNGNTYTTDEQGRIIRCEATPKRSTENPRDVNAQLQAGGEDRRSSDQGGHIVGRDLNGDGGAGNLVAMDSKINQSDYKRMENDIKATLDEGKDVTVTIDISYSGDSKRPDTITATVTADEVKTVYKFDNNLDGGLKDEVPENGKDAVQEELNDTNGEISSIKEEYNENGELTETTVNITYTDENGTNHRTKVYIDAE